MAGVQNKERIRREAPSYIQKQTYHNCSKPLTRNTKDQKSMDYNTRSKHLLSPRNSLHWQIHTKTESKRIENNITSKCNLKARRSKYVYI
jgi:hypothetical protein